MQTVSNCMKYQNLFSVKNKKNISIRHLQKILLRVLRVKCLLLLLLSDYCKTSHVVILVLEQNITLTVFTLSI